MSLSRFTTAALLAAAIVHGAAPVQAAPQTAINAVNTPGDADSVFKITQPGSYYLPANLNGQVGKHGIEVDSASVRIDLGGFVVQGVPGARSAIATGPFAQVLTVGNGLVNGWGNGVEAPLVTQTMVHDLTLYEITGAAVRASTVSTVERCRINDVGLGVVLGDDSRAVDCTVREAGAGVHAGAGSTVRGCRVVDCSGVGVTVGDRGLVTGCTSTGNTDGIFTGADALVSGCVASGNTGQGIRLPSGTVQDCTARANGAEGIVVGDGALVTRCDVSGGSLAGIRAGSASTIRESVAQGCSGGPALQVGIGGAVIDCVGSYSSIGVFAAERSLVSGCSTVGNSTVGVVVYGGTVRSCVSRTNQDAGITMAGSGQVLECSVSGNALVGISAPEGRVRIEANHVTEHPGAVGILVAGTGHSIVRNTLAGNGVHVQAPAVGNFVGPLVAPGALVGRNDPWANLVGN